MQKVLKLLMEVHTLHPLYAFVRCSIIPSMRAGSYNVTIPYPTRYLIYTWHTHCNVHAPLLGISHDGIVYTVPVFRFGVLLSLFMDVFLPEPSVHTVASVVDRKVNSSFPASLASPQPCSSWTLSQRSFMLFREPIQALRSSRRMNDSSGVMAAKACSKLAMKSSFISRSS